MVNVDFCGNLKKEIFAALGKPRKTRHGMQVYWNVGAGFDCETTQTPKRYAYVYIWQFSINRQTFIGRSCDTFYEFAKTLDGALKTLYYRGTHKKPKAFPKLLVYIANMGYEWSFFKTKFLELGISKTFAKEPRKPLSLTVGECLEFRECLGLWGGSLAEVAKNYTKTQKLVGDLDYSIPRNSKTFLTPKELAYCENDVQILSELGMITFKKFHERPIPYTNTGIIRNDVKTRMQAKGKLYFEGIKEAVKRIYPHNLREYRIAMKYLFCGGLTHANYRYVGKKLSCVQCADLTSDYPACMAHNTFPAGTLLTNCTVEDMEKYPHWYALFTFSNVESKTGHTLISEHKIIESEKATFDNGRVYSAKTLSVYLNEIDFENFDALYKYDDEFSICDIHCFTQSKLIPSELFDVLFEQYRIKALLKKEQKSETIEYIESKKIVNGCFGFTATRLYLTDVILQNGDLKETNKIKKFRSIRFDIRTGERSKGRTYILKNQEEEVYKILTKNVWLNPFIAVYTTSYARRILVDIISRFPDCVVQYDTDSIYYLKEHKDGAKLREYMENYNKEIEEMNREIFDNDDLYLDLGTWDFDKPCIFFKSLGAKRYLKQTGYKIKLVCAGCKSKAFTKFCDKNGYDYFKVFTRDMLLNEFNSMKTTMRYYPKKDKPYIDTITDTQGHTQTVKIDTCGVITNIPFSLSMNGEWLKLIETLLENEKRV